MNMKIEGFVRFLLLIHFYICFGSCEYYEPLIVTYNGSNYEVVKPTNIDGQIGYVNDETSNKEYFCPEKNDSKLLKAANFQNFPNILFRHGDWTQRTLSGKNCFRPVKATIFSQFQSDSIYQIGFHLYNPNLTEPVVAYEIDSDRPNILIIKTNMSQKMHQVHLLKVHYDHTKKETRAVEYTLLKYNSHHGGPPITLRDIGTSNPYQRTKATPHFERSLRTENFVNFFSWDTQFNFFKNIFGYRPNGGYTLSSKNKLEPRQLAPRKDFALSAWKEVTLFYENVAPMWTKFMENWDRIETTIRQLASKADNELKVIAGVTGTLQMWDNKGNYISICDANADINVPAYFWKALEYRNAGLIIIMHNSSTNSPHNKICANDECQKYGYAISNNTIELGLTYCCMLNTQSIQGLEASTILQSKESILDLNAWLTRS